MLSLHENVVEILRNVLVSEWVLGISGLLTNISVIWHGKRVSSDQLKKRYCFLCSLNEISITTTCSKQTGLLNTLVKLARANVPTLPLQVRPPTAASHFSVVPGVAWQPRGPWRRAAQAGILAERLAWGDKDGSAGPVQRGAAVGGAEGGYPAQEEGQFSGVQF